MKQYISRIKDTVSKYTWIDYTFIALFIISMAILYHSIVTY